MNADNQKLRGDIQAGIDACVDPLPGSQPYDNYRPLNVPAAMGGGTLADYLALRHPHISAEHWVKAAQAGRLQRRGEPVDLALPVHGGDQLMHVVPNTVEPPVNTGIRVLYVDDTLLVVFKPAPLPVHPCGRFNRNSLIWILSEACKPLGLRPRIAHRLDANTAGIMVFTLSKSAATHVQEQFSSGTIRKLYLATVQGCPSWSTCSCSAPIGRKTVAAGGRLIDADGNPAFSRFRVLRRGAMSTQLAAIPITGRTNQLRAHLWHLGFPIVGDSFYRPEQEINPKQTHGLDDPPLMLQAVRIAFIHPATGRTVQFEIPDVRSAFVLDVDTHVLHEV
jgi:RluA family pseudouridine synthase